MEKSKGNKASNIYQVLKGSGAWQSKDSKGPMIKGVGIKSPLNLVGTQASIEYAKQNKQKKKNAETRKSGKAVSYEDAYADADMKKYGGEGGKKKFIEDAKKWNQDKYGTENPTSEAKKQKITKKQLADNVAKKNESSNNNQSENNQSENNQSENNQSENNQSSNNEDKPKNVAVEARKEVAATNKSKRKARKAENKAKRKAKKAANQQKRADRIKKEGGTKVGNFLRKAVGKVEKVVNKKEESPAKLVGAKKKIKKYLKKKVQPKLKAVEAVNAAGVVVRKQLKKKKLDHKKEGQRKDPSPVKLVEGEHDWQKDLNKKKRKEKLEALAKKYPKTAKVLKDKGITPDNAVEKGEEALKKGMKKGAEFILSKINK
jgi:hypothetical protein